ncbi:MAG: radical SAM protein [Deltaproteobacteria bacterium]|nr:MAG: radical SAM protein [Deltaproteobacteria bacterium]
MHGRWEIVEGLRGLLADEEGTLVRPAPTRIALCYPSPYRAGMSSLGFQAIYREINAHPGCAAERAFLPDEVESHRAARVPVLTVESQRPIGEFGCLAFSVSYELELPGLFEVLDLSGIPVRAAERGESDPLVVCGGPLTFSNPVPLAPFADLIVLGEAEESIHELCEALRSGLSKHAILETLGKRPGLWVPALGGEMPEVARASDDLLPARSQIVTPNTELRSMFLIEPERGCSRGCTYCVMRRTTNGGMRTVPPERVLELVPAHARRVGLVGAAVTDHPRIVDLVRTLAESGREVSISSLRADRLCARPELVRLLREGGGRTLTTAADGASERLRKALDRKTTAAQLVRTAELAREAGFAKLKLYLMVGLPGEEDKDLEELADLGKEISRIVPLSFGCAPFVAKRNTPMDGAPWAGVAEVERKLAFLRAKLRGRAEIRPTSARWAFVEYMLAQGGQEAGLATEDAWREGGSYAAFRKAFERRSVRPHAARRTVDGRLRLPALAAWPSVSA